MSGDSGQMGHNGGPSLYLREIGKLQAIEAVLKDHRYSQTEALVLIGLIVRTNAHYADAFPGGATLALYAKVKQTDPVFKALRRLEDYFGVINRESRGPGRSNTYSVMPQRIVDAIVEQFEARKAAKAAATHPDQAGGSNQGTHPDKQGGSMHEPTRLETVGLGGRPDEAVTPAEMVGSEPTPTNTVGQSKTHPDNKGGSASKPTTINPVGLEGHPDKQGATHPDHRGIYPSLIHPEERKRGEAPLTPKNEFVPVDWRSALNPDSAADAEDVFWVEDCKIEVLNGFRAELEATFPNVDLASGLAIVAGEALPTETGTALKKRIRRRFGYLNNDEKNRDRRATARSREPRGAAAAQPSKSAHRRAVAEELAEKIKSEKARRSP